MIWLNKYWFPSITAVILLWGIVLDCIKMRPTASPHREARSSSTDHTDDCLGPSRTWPPPSRSGLIPSNAQSALGGTAFSCAQKSHLHYDFFLSNSLELFCFSSNEFLIQLKTKTRNYIKTDINIFVTLFFLKIKGMSKDNHGEDNERGRKFKHKWMDRWEGGRLSVPPKRGMREQGCLKELYEKVQI